MSGFEAARESMEQGIAGNQTQAPVETSQKEDNSFQAESNNLTQQEIIELDKLEKFKYKGRELSAKDIEAWERGHMMQSDYTRKTQALSEERKYYDNLAVDLAAVKGNPALESEFRKIYPEKYHSYLDFLGDRNNSQKLAEHQQQVEQKQSLDPDVMARLKKVDELENYIKEQEVKTVSQKLDVIFAEKSKKYHLADEESVLAMAQALHNQGTQLDDTMWDKIWSTVHNKVETKFKSYQKDIITKQQDATKRGIDTAGGGGVPGQAPKRMSFKEATEAAVRDAKAGRI